MTANISSALWSAEVRVVCNHLWQSTLFAGVIALLALLLRKHQAKTRYWLWMAASAKFLIPFSLLVSLGSHMPWPSHAKTTSGTYTTINQITQPFSELTIIDSPTVASTSQPTGGPALVRSIPEVLAAIWLLGMIAMSCFWLVQWRRLSILMRSSQPLLEGREVDLLRKVERVAGLERQTTLLSSCSPMEPGVFGIVRSTIVWPERISQYLDDLHLEAILIHEVCHVRRRDNLTSVVHMLVETIFWFHPMVWWMEAQLVKERERACDEQVLGICKQPRVYAESILKVCEFCVEPPMVCVPGIRGGDLKKRIAQIMMAGIPSNMGLVGRSLLLSTAAMTVALPMLIGQIARTPPAPLQLSTSTVASGGGKQADEKSTKRQEFEVATIRLNKSGDDPDRMSATPNGLTITNVPLQTIIAVAYHLKDPDFASVARLIPGAPSWIKSDRYDIRAKMTDSDVEELRNLRSDQQWERQRLMLQTLLVDRFQLRSHFETEEGPIYALVLSKNGPKIGKEPDDAISRYDSNRTHIKYTAVPVGDLAARLASLTGRPVVDQTGLTGKYDFNLTWIADEIPSPFSTAGSPVASPATDSSGPSIYTALQEQLGLKLEPTKGSVQILVIDHIERPSEN
jgi:bla regulator protein BlaR1